MNEFNGTLPGKIGTLRLLRFLSVKNNTMTGHLPDTWDENTLIEDLQAANNNFNSEQSG